ncbi:hypothetical protein LINPERHAP2_LOCUS15545 [Linum perenne]
MVTSSLSLLSFLLRFWVFLSMVILFQPLISFTLQTLILVLPLVNGLVKLTLIKLFLLALNSLITSKFSISFSLASCFLALMANFLLPQWIPGLCTLLSRVVTSIFAASCLLRWSLSAILLSSMTYPSTGSSLLSGTSWHSPTVSLPVHSQGGLPQHILRRIGWSRCIPMPGNGSGGGFNISGMDADIVDDLATQAELKLRVWCD